MACIGIVFEVIACFGRVKEPLLLQHACSRSLQQSYAIMGMGIYAVLLEVSSEDVHQIIVP